MLRSLIRSPAKAALLAFLFALPWSGALVGTGFPSPARFLALATLAGILPYVLSRGFRTLSPITLVFLAYAVVFVVSGFWVISPDDWADKGIALFSVAVALFVLDQSRHIPVPSELMVRALVWGAAVLALVVWLNSLQGNRSEFGRVSAGLLDPNEVAVYIALGACGLFMEERNLFSGVTRWVLLIWLSVAILYTGSRTGLIGMLGLSAVALVASGHAFHRKIALVLGFIVAAIALSLAWEYIPEQVTGRFTKTSAQLAGDERFDRFVVWAGGLDVISRYLPLGTGGGGFAQGMLYEAGRYVVAHNILIGWAGEFGVFSIPLFFSVGALLFVLLMGSRRDAGRMGVLIVCFIASMSLVIEIRPMVWVFLWVVWFGSDCRSRKGDLSL